MVVVGIDSHKDTLAGCAIDEVGRAVDCRSFGNTAAGHAQALCWVRGLDTRRVAIEGSGGYGRPLALVLVVADLEVVDVPPQMTARARRGQRSRHKSDSSDALLIARVGAREDDLPRPRPEGVIEDLRSLVLYRHEQVLSLNREVNRLHADLNQIQPGYKQNIRGRLTLPSPLNKVIRLISADRSVRADIVRQRVRTTKRLVKHIAELDDQIGQLLDAAGGATLTDIYGIETHSAAQILAEVGNPSRYATKARFAMANGTAPLQASSGRVVRHRLNRGGNRRLNRTIHIAAISQIRRPGTEGRLYYERLQARGKTKQEEAARFRGFRALLSVWGVMLRERRGLRSCRSW